MCGTRLAVALSGLGGAPLSPSCRHKSHPGPKPRCPSAARLLASKSSLLPRFPRRRPPLTFPPPRAGPDRRRTEPVTAVPTQSSAAAGCHSVVSRRSRHRVCFRCRPPHHLVFPRAGPPGAPATEPSSEKSSLREPLEAELAVYLDRSPMRPSPTFRPRGAAAAGAPPFHAGPSVAPPRCASPLPSRERARASAYQPFWTRDGNAVGCHAVGPQGRGPHTRLCKPAAALLCSWAAK
jgi:hypothetical protein